MSKSTESTIIFHAALPDEWDAAQDVGLYEMSTRGVTLADEGFIHCSKRSQAEGVANRYYSDITNLVLLTLDRQTIGSPVVDEVAVSTGERFPHIYGPIPVAAVVSATAWSVGTDGVWRFPTAPSSFS